MEINQLLFVCFMCLFYHLYQQFNCQFFIPMYRESVNSLKRLLKLPSRQHLQQNPRLRPFFLQFEKTYMMENHCVSLMHFMKSHGGFYNNKNIANSDDPVNIEFGLYHPQVHQYGCHVVLSETNNCDMNNSRCSTSKMEI